MRTIITPHLWFDREAEEAASFYTSLFPDSKIVDTTVLHDTPSGDTPVVSFVLAGQPFMAISAGPLFTFNPSVSFILNFDPSRDAKAKERLDALWKTLSAGGEVLMPLEEYFFSKRYGWIQDKYGLSWQLILTNPDGEERPFITPSLMYAGPVAGRAEEAMHHYLSVFSGKGKGETKMGSIQRYPDGSEPDKPGTVMYADFLLNGNWYAVMDSARNHDFVFNEAVSFVVSCDTQEEIDYFWSTLSAVPEAEQCGWLKDKFGVSWQIVPAIMDDMIRNGTKEQIRRLTQAFLKMKKFDIDALQRAHKG